MIASRELVCVVLVTYCALSCAVSLHERQRRESPEYFIEYVTANSTESQTVVITDIDEVKLGSIAVIDYRNGLMTFVFTPEADRCNVIKLDRQITPKLVEIKNALDLNKVNVLEMPTGSQKKNINLKDSDDQSTLELSPLSKALCQGRTVVRMEKDSRTYNGSTAVARRKRDVGPGEVVVVIVVVVVLFYAWPAVVAAAG